ncbi:hypothetical protein AALA22_13145 [Anaerovoracaceae bacterium 41-7]
MKQIETTEEAMEYDNSVVYRIVLKDGAITVIAERVLDKSNE